jgi:hypothetical protein
MKSILTLLKKQNTGEFKKSKQCFPWSKVYEFLVILQAPIGILVLVLVFINNKKYTNNLMNINIITNCVVMVSQYIFLYLNLTTRWEKNK